MPLETYHKKRDFKSTPEPRGRKTRRRGNRFVVQKHDAQRLHYDLRLELDGVLKSWAVTKGPSLVAGEKRLAVEVEDHPLEYAEFEGTIPKGEYGGGAVVLWDRGSWKPLGDPHEGLTKGHLDFELEGEKLGGRWHLVRMARKPREKRRNWLLIKSEDEAARPADAADILDERPASVKTGRDVGEVAKEEPGWSSRTGKIGKDKVTRDKARSAKDGNDGTNAAPADPSHVDGARKGALPAFVEPTLATLASSPPSGDRWIHEIKFDGYRLQARLEAGRVKLLTRSGLDWTKKFGKEIVAALRDLPAGKALLDGELVVENDNGASDFSALQADLSAGRHDRFVYYAFDLLHLDGYDLQRVPLVKRKTLLQKIVGEPSGRVRYSRHFAEGGALVLRHACRLSLEGVVSKERDAAYRSGRHKGWIKSKCSARQEFVVAGYVPSSVSRKAIGSLVLGVYDGKKLHHVGRVGTGFTKVVAQELHERLEHMRVKESPFDEALSAEEARQVRFARPELVAEIEFQAWTADGNLRHASFRGLREDKPASEIVREKIKTKSASPATQRRTVRLTHPDRIYWPDAGVTKEGLADYYAEVWHKIAPFIVGRPLALLRCPSGIEGQKFFQKHVQKGLDRNIVPVRDPKDKKGPPLVSIDDLDGLMGLVQSATLEIHPWGSTVSDWERPDILVMDLDPGEGASWQTVTDAAQEVRERLESAGLPAFLKTSGGKGLHVVSPLKPKAKWAAVKAFTKGIADAMAADSPDRFVATITKSKRRGKVLVDYLRNQRGATAVAPYSTRARPGAPVAMPLAWDELSAEIGSAYFTVANTPARLLSMDADPWDGFHSAAAPLPTAKR